MGVMTIGEIPKGIDELPINRKRRDLLNWLDTELRAWFAIHIGMRLANPGLVS